MKPMTYEEFTKHRGSPLCPVEIEGKQAIQEAGCSDCDSEWHEVYQLTGYVLTHNGRDEK
jgi:hypothetical protein